MQYGAVGITRSIPCPPIRGQGCCDGPPDTTETLHSSWSSDTVLGVRVDSEGLKFVRPGPGPTWD
jgi:hypothetical protein